MFGEFLKELGNAFLQPLEQSLQASAKQAGQQAAQQIVQQIDTGLFGGSQGAGGGGGAPAQAPVLRMANPIASSSSGEEEELPWGEGGLFG